MTTLQETGTMTQQHASGASPSSVLAIIPSSTLPQPETNRIIDRCSIRSIVVVDDEATELVIDEFENLSVSSSGGGRDIFSSPRKTRTFAMSNNKSSCRTPVLRSLLDDEHSSCYTPTPPTKQPPMTVSSETSRTPCSNSVACCQFVACSSSRDDDFLEMMKLQEKINELLGLTGDSNDWQGWYCGFAAASSPEVQKEANHILRNRAFSVRERQVRLDSVRRDLVSPFSSTPTRRKLSPMKFSRKVKSFDLSNHVPSVSDGMQRQKKYNGKPLLQLVSLFEAGCLCNTTTSSKQDESPFVIRSAMLNVVQEDAYDSDPEDFTRRRSKPTTPLPGDTLDQSNKENMGFHSNKKRSRRKSNHNMSMENDASVSQSVQEFMNETFTLILHTTRESDKYSRPVSIKAWFERGQHLNSNRVIQPRLMWHLIQRNPSQSKSELTIPQCDVFSCDLIDVARVLAVETVDRQLHAFAKPSCCFLLKTLDKSFLFEAKIRSERDRIVSMLKLTVARLGSKLVVGDPSFFDEYFVTISDGPGEAPEFF